jgi:hypothetical protein
MGGGAVAPEGKALAGIIIRERTTLDLPPGFTLVTLRELGDAFSHAREIAAASGAATIVWSRRATMAEFAIVLEPDEPLAQARRGFYAGMNALADALAARMPPEKPLAFDWPDAIRIDGGLIGGGRLAWPTGVAEHAVPDWLGRRDPRHDRARGGGVRAVGPRRSDRGVLAPLDGDLRHMARTRLCAGG